VRVTQEMPSPAMFNLAQINYLDSVGRQKQELPFHRHGDCGTFISHFKRIATRAEKVP
jgi:hypothetical protein